MENNKSFWSRPEGTLGKITMVGIIAGLGYGFMKILPYLITLVTNTIYLGILLGVLFVMIMTVLNPRFQITCWYLFKGAMRFFTGLVIQMNPIAILESYIEDIKSKMIQMEEQLQSLNGQIGKLKRKISERKEGVNKHLSLAEQAKKMEGREADVQLNSMQAQRLLTYVTKMQALCDRMELLQKVLSKMKYYSDIMIKNTTYEVEIKKDEYESIQKSHSVMKSAMNIIAGNTDKKAIFDEAMGYIVDDIGFKVGEMERMLEASSSFISSVDLEDAASADQGLKLLEQFEEKGLETIFGKGTNSTPSAVPVIQNLNNQGGLSSKYFN